MTAKKPKALRILALLLALAILGAVLFVANGFLGNPISALLARRGAQAYLRDMRLPDPYAVTDVSYDFKFSHYVVDVSVPDSADKHFALFCDSLGRVKSENYHVVSDGFNTYSRLSKEYRALAEPVLSALPFTTDMAFVDVMTQANEYPEGMPQSALIPDKAYDILSIGRQYGLITLYANAPDVTPERAAQILLSLREACDKADIPFAEVYFSLREPKGEEGYDPDGKEIICRKVRYEDIRKDGMAERVKSMWNETMRYFEEMDKEKMGE